MLGTLRALKFLVMAPLILVFLTIVNVMTSPGDWWVQWAALGLGIAWFFSLLRLLRGLILLGGLAALGYWLWRRYGDRLPREWAPADAGSPPGAQPQPAPLRLPH